MFTLQGHQQRVYSLQFDGQTVVSGSLDTNIMVFLNLNFFLNLKFNFSIGLVCIDRPPTSHAYGSSESDLWDGITVHVLFFIFSYSLSRNNILVSGNADSTVKMWDIRTGQLIRTLDDRQCKHEVILVFMTHYYISVCCDVTAVRW